MATVTISVDGRPVTGQAGQTIAALLIAAGQTAWRQASDGGGRGLFCGIGLCRDCLVDLNGLGQVRSCQRLAADGDVVVSDRPRLGPGGRRGIDPAGESGVEGQP